MEKTFVRSRGGKAIAVFMSLIIALSVILVPLSEVTTASAGSSVSGSTVSGISSSIYIPSSYKEGTKVPLYVAMHGCTQSASQFATSTGINTLADQKGFIVLHLQQSSSNNMMTCFKWYSDQSRTSTEPKAIVSIIDSVKSKYSIDADKVYCFGFSAGAAMAHLLCACYPDVFSGGCVGSGIPYKGASSMNYSSAMSSGTSVSNSNLASYIVSAMGNYKKVMPMIVFQGTSDYTVNQNNGAACAMSWVLAMNQIGANINTTPNKTSGNSYTIESYVDSTTGKTVVQYYLVSGMGHAWSGGSGTSYAYASGPKATQIMYDFFEDYWAGESVEPSDTTAPVTTVTPAAGTYTSEITVSFSVNEAATTYYTTNGTNPTTNSTVYTGPFKVSADTTVKYFSVDTAGNKEDVKSVTYDINIPVVDTVAPVTTVTPVGGVYYEPINVTLSVNENATTYYTIDGSTPTTNSPVYTGTFVVSSDTTVNFFSVDNAGNAESVKSVDYTIVTSIAEGESIELSIAGRDAKLFVSGKYREGVSMPLIVMLHGDGQTAEQFELLTGMNDIADSKGFLVLYLSAESTSPLTSWEWYSTAAQTGAGDTAYIINAINTIKSTYTIDSDKVYAVGFGAGAAMANTVAATNPNVIQAIAVVSGTQYASADSLNGSFNAKVNGGTEAGDAIVNAMGTNGKVTPVIVIHGAMDETFAPVNADITISQWADANDILDNEVGDNSVTANYSDKETFTGYSKYVYKNTNGLTVMEKYIVDDMGYAWAGGNVAGDYTYPAGPNASELICTFFASTAGLDYYVEPGEIDITAPITSTLPEGGTYDQTLLVFISTNETATTYYTLDGSTPTTASTIYTAPIEITETTTLKFFSVDTAGNVEDVKTREYVIVENEYTSKDISYDKSNSGYAGSINIFGYGTDTIKAGLAGMYNGESIRGFVSFDTSSVDLSNASSVVLRLHVSSWGSAVNSISIDVANGYFGSAGIQLSDYRASASATGIATASPVSSGYVDLVIPESAYQYLNNHVEFRICSTVTNGFSENVVEFSNATLIVTSATPAAASTFALTREAVVYAADDAVAFADWNLKNALVNAGYDKNNDGELSESEMAMIYGIDLSGLGITNISGLEYATNLKFVDLSNNALTSIDALASCAELQYVDVSDNKLTSIVALANATKIFILAADNNDITSISAVAGLENVVTLSFAGNEIKDISALQNMSSIRKVNFASNSIEDINAISTLTYVNYLYFSDNEITSLAAIADLEYLFDAQFDKNRIDITDDVNAGIIADLTSKGVEIVVGEQKEDEEKIPTGIYDVTYVIDGDKVVFTVKTSPDYNRVKVTTEDDLKGYIKYTSNFTTDADGYYISTLTVPAVNGTTRYAFNGRDAETGVYSNDYYYEEVTVEIKDENPIKSISYNVNDDKVEFTVVTDAGEYNRIKVTTADNLGSSIAVGTTYTIDANGDYVWTIKTNAPSETTTFAFDVRSSETGKYLKKYVMQEVEIIDIEIVKSVSYTIEDDKIIFTVTTIAGEYNRIKVTTADNLGGSLGVGNYKIDANGDYVWTVKADAPTSATEYAFDIRSSVTGKYIKDYYIFTAEPIVETNDIKSVTYVVEDDKLIFTVVSAAGAYNRIKVSFADNLGGSLGVGNYTVAANGDYVWTVKVDAPDDIATYAFDLRSSETGKYTKNYFIVEFDGYEKVEIIKSATYTIEDGKLVFTVVSSAGEYNRIKVTTEDNLGGSLGVGTYKVADNGDYVWTVKTAIPSETTTYAFDLRSSETGKYLKEYFILNVAM
ncbi:MAG: PHB depolymerase family esterase [Clostridia bacterium]|nr:PHB depolymerase family esterase [Clostridia bacterium]